MHIIYMHRSTPWLFIFGVYKCVCELTAVFLYWRRLGNLRLLCVVSVYVSSEQAPSPKSHKKASPHPRLNRKKKASHLRVTCSLRYISLGLLCGLPLAADR